METVLGPALTLQFSPIERCGGLPCDITDTATHQELEREEAGQGVGDGDVAEGDQQARQVQKCVGECPRNKIAAAGGAGCGARQADAQAHARVTQ